MIDLCLLLLLMILCGAIGKTIQDGFILKILCGETGILYTIVLYPVLLLKILFDALGNLYKIVLY